MEIFSVGGKSGIHYNFLQNVLGGKPWTVSCTIANNGFSLTTTDALPDTGANGYIFINRRLAKQALTYLRPEKITDFTPSPVAGFDGKATQLIDVALIMNLKIHGRNFLQVPFLVIDMKHDIILGRKWFEKHGVKIDCQEGKLEYSDEMQQSDIKDIPMERTAYLHREPELLLENDNDSLQQKLHQKNEESSLGKDNKHSELRRSARILMKKRNYIDEIQKPSCGTDHIDSSKDLMPTQILDIRFVRPATFSRIAEKVNL